jgi:hypothetical protein
MAKSAYQKDSELRDRLNRVGIPATIEDARALRRAELALQRWGEQECGDGNGHASWAIERDESTGKPYRVVYPHDGKSRRYPIPDREQGAIKRVRAICARLGCHYFHQTDPRGCALYVSAEPLKDTDYSRGTGCCID